MKKLFAVLTAATFALSLAACSGSGSSSQSASGSQSSSATAETTSGEGTSYRVAIVQQVDHSSLDEIRKAIEAELDARAAADGITIEYTEFNGQGDSTVLNQIGSQVVSDGYDAVIPIASLAAQCMVNAVDGSIPVVYAAISDPATAGLTDLENVTGTSDALDTKFILDMMFAVNPDIQTVGLLYSNSEPNSETPIAEAKAYLDEKGISYVEAAGAVAEALTDAGIPFYAGADSFVTSGAFATCGVNYTDLGTKTADMAVDALQTGTVPSDYYVMEGGVITVNNETAAALGLDYSVFNDMANTVVEVTTAAAGE